MEEDLTGVLLASSAVVEMAGDRITWLRRTQGKPLPAVVLHKITAGRSYTMDGPSRTVGAIVQIDCWASTFTAAVDLARAVLATLEGLTHERFQGAFLMDTRDDVETDGAPQASGSNDFFRSSLDFRVWHTSAT